MISSVLVLTVTFVVWAVVHSLLASLPFKSWTRRLLGAGVDRWYRLAYVVFAGITLPMTMNLLTLYVLTTLYFVVGSVHEEHRLLDEFGAAYRDYQRQVPRLIPRPERCCAPPSG
jgi:hypothetical protein